MYFMVALGASGVYTAFECLIEFQVFQGVLNCYRVLLCVVRYSGCSCDFYGVLENFSLLLYVRRVFCRGKFRHGIFMNWDGILW